MKKSVCITMAIVICSCLLVCLSKDNTFVSEIQAKVSVDEKKVTDVSPVTQINDYYSIDHFLNEFAEDISCINSSIINNTENSISSELLSSNSLNEDSVILSSFSSNRLNENSIYIPCVNNLPVELRQTEGYPTISFFPEEEYGQPWIWYFIETEDGSNAYIKIMYLDTVLEDEKIIEANSEGVIWTINQIPLQTQSAVSTLDNVDSTNRIITLSDKKVTAVQTSSESDARVKVQFVYDEVLVVICAKPDLLTDNWFSNLNFKTTMLK